MNRQQTRRSVDIPLLAFVNLQQNSKGRTTHLREISPVRRRLRSANGLAQTYVRAVSIWVSLFFCARILLSVR
jgi:hypothetical protein